MPYQELPGLGMRGLNTDTPAQALDHTEFSAGNNMRPLDNSLQTVYDFLSTGNDFQPDAMRNIYGVTQWNRTGADTLTMVYLYNGNARTNHGDSFTFVQIHTDNDFVMATDGDVASFPIQNKFTVQTPAYTIYLDPIENPPTRGYDNLDDRTTWDFGSDLNFLSGSNEDHAIYSVADDEVFITNDVTNLNFQVILDVTDPGNENVPGVHAETPLDVNEDFGINMFSFNNGVIANDGINHPVFIRETSENFFVTTILNGWSQDETEITSGNRYFIGSRDGASTFDWTTVGAPSDPTVGEVFTATADGTLTGDDRVAPAITAQRIFPYNNRLVAVHIGEDYLNSTELGAATLRWSTTIAQLGSLDGLEWIPSSNNSAGDDILTETPGVLLDGGALGQYLIVYKSDGVYRYTDVGEPLYLVGELLFDDDGLYSTGCFADIGGGRHFVVGNYGIYIHDGGPNKQNVSRNRIEKSFYSAVNPLHRNRTHVFHNRPEKEVWVCYSSGMFDYPEWDPYSSYDIEEQDMTGRVYYRHDDGIRLYSSLTAKTAAADYVQSNSYSTGDAVVYLGDRFQAIADIPASSLDPSSNDDWVRVNPGDVFEQSSDDPDDFIVVEHWFEVLSDGTDEAYVYNYELDAWHTRDIPHAYVDPLGEHHGCRQIIEGEERGRLYAYCSGGNGIEVLSTERDETPTFLEGNMEFHYLSFGDPSRVKHLHSAYPHSMNTVKIDIDTTNNLGISGQPDFLEQDIRTFDPTTDQYKIDYRVHGRYYHIRLESDSVGNQPATIINPNLTGMGFEMKIGGQR